MSARYWVVIPAAGAGRRVSGRVSKQYLPLAGRTVIEWAMAPFLADANALGIVVAVAAHDDHYKSLSISGDSRVRFITGGAERADSVLRGVESLQVNADDWVLVHDAARPCLQAEDLARLIAELQDDDVGGLLAAPITETVKSADASKRVSATVPRGSLWRALTPQMFRVGLLMRALREAEKLGKLVTDESAAIELLGLEPRLVTGSSDNIKVTVPEDLRQAEYILLHRNSN